MTSDVVPTGAVVAGTDGSPKAEAAVDWAAEEAARRGTGLHVLYAYPWLARARAWELAPPAEALDAGRGLVRDAAERVRSAHGGLTVTTQVTVADPAFALVEASAGAAVVVIGAVGHGGLARSLGSVAQKVAAHAHGPVIVFRDRPPHPDGPVVVGMDPNEGAPEAMAYAFDEAARRRVRVVVLQAWQHARTRGEVRDDQTRRFVSDYRRRAGQRTRERVQEWQARHPDVPVELRQVAETPVDALLEASHEAGVVVVGRSGHTGLVGLLLGSVSRGVLAGAHVTAVVRVRHGERRARSDLDLGAHRPPGPGPVARRGN
ncbi:universal stress protein [Georgenia sp. AZ-5]|uniref:universal stress protein n=1 Tax=Georgenia sp. AZ-5 TaxID=3367526 RepID=UPI003753EBAC